MGRRNRLLVAVLTAGLLGAGVVLAGIPDPDLSVVPNVFYSPGGTSAYTVVVNSTEGPVDSAVVQVVFSTEADGLVCWCDGQAHPIITGTTNSAGTVTFFIEAGGCINPDSLASAPAVEVFANGIKLAEVGAVSGDAVDGAGRFPWQGWVTGGLCSAGLSDATTHTAPVATGTYEYCSDVDSDGVVGLSDAVLLTVAIASGETCTEGP